MLRELWAGLQRALRSSGGRARPGPLRVAGLRDRDLERALRRAGFSRGAARRALHELKTREGRAALREVFGDEAG